MSRLKYKYADLCLILTKNIADCPMLWFMCYMSQCMKFPTMWYVRSLITAFASRLNIFKF